MKTQTWLRMLGVVTLVLALGTGVGQAQNLIVNGDFETDAPADKTGWTAFDSELSGASTALIAPSSVPSPANWLRNSTSAHYAFEDSEVFPGEASDAYAVRIGGVGTFLIAQTGLVLRAGTRYLVGFDAFTPAPGAETWNRIWDVDVRLAYGWSDPVNFADGAGVQIVTGYLPVNSDGVASRKSAYFVPMVSDENYVLQVQANGGNSGSVFVDNIELTDVGPGYEILNGGFESNTWGTSGSGADSELAGSCTQVGGYGSSFADSWADSGWVYKYHEGTEDFPDGAYAVALVDYATGTRDGIIGQGNLYFQAGKHYRLTFDLWTSQADSFSDNLDVRLAYGVTAPNNKTQGTQVALLVDDKQSTRDGSVETVSVEFTPTVTTNNYALQFFVTDSNNADEYAWLDNVRVENIPTGTIVSIR